MTSDLTAQRVRELLSYDRSTGEFAWICAKNGVTVGKTAGNVCGGVTIDGVRYRLNDIANLHALGEWRPERGAALTQQRLRDLLHYEPSTGAFTWRGVYRRIPEGTRAEKPHSDGYLTLSLDGKPYLVHRLAWFYMTGRWPVEVDHEDTDRRNNVWTNLREVSHQKNTFNLRRAKSNNELGVLGVSRSGDGFRARIEVDGVETRLGKFPTPEEASAAYLDKKAELHAIGGFSQERCEGFDLTKAIA